ncbi:serine O-acetyltransferase [Gordonia sp. Z-3]|uniref:serine O-acetyltransferase n=1 Tax=Gordonia sp. Z-3 TaxID=3115408 RepID=UPI003FA56D5D
MSGFWPRVARFYFRYRLTRHSIFTGITIPPRTFGRGLCLPHFGTIIVNAKTRAGDWCTVHCGVNIGVADGGVPKLGDGVYIGPGAVLYGGISIGDLVAVGANSVVNRDAPSRTTIAGAPAREISAVSSHSLISAAGQAALRAHDGSEACP